MGLFLCSNCNKSLGSEIHICKHEDVKLYVEKLELRAREAENELRQIQDSVLLIMETLPTLDKEEVLVKSELLENLWKSVKLQWYKSEHPKDFLLKWMTLHRILTDCFYIFKPIRNGKKETLVEKLAKLKESCQHAQEVFGYQDSKLILSPEDLIKEDASH